MAQYMILVVYKLRFKGKYEAQTEKNVMYTIAFNIFIVYVS